MKKTIIWIIVGFAALWLFVPKFKEFISKLFKKETTAPVDSPIKTSPNSVAYTGTVYTASVDPKDISNSLS